MNYDFDILVFIQPTSPLLSADYINEGINILLKKNHNFDSVCSVYKEHWIPRWELNGKPYNWNINNRPEGKINPEKYVENGAFYITSRKKLMESKLRYSGKIAFVEMPTVKAFKLMH